MKKVLILFGQSAWKKSAPPKEGIYRNTYEYLYALFEKNNIKLYRASYSWYEEKRKSFRHAWTFSQSKGWTKCENIKPDLVFDKTPSGPEVLSAKMLIGKNYPFVNNIRFTEIVRNKLTLSLLFEKWSKKSWPVQNREELKNILPRIGSSKVVLKPTDQSGGKGVQIFSKSESLRKSKLDQNYIAQDFIDSSRGVPGLSKSYHDLRLYIVNDQITHSLIREPKKGSLLANVAQGGSVTFVPVEKLPRSISPIIKRANELFEIFKPRIYSIDLMFDSKKRPWVIEFNSMPGLYFTPDSDAAKRHMCNQLLTIFRTQLSKKNG